MLKRRYPGVSPFTKEQKNIFFGRNHDIQELQELILLRNQVLLYSKSGVGKTSLLNAGVLPEFEKKYTIIKIRFFAYNNEKDENLTTKTLNKIKPLLKNNVSTILDKITQTIDYKKTFWYYFKQLQLTTEKRQKYILVFDQFEELFSYPKEQINDFKEQLYELTKISIPDNIMQLIAKESENEEIDKLYDNLKIKTIYSIRSDRLSLLNQLSDKLPDVQETFYELKPLDKKQAKEAIVNPAKDANNFETPPFNIEAQAIENIINALSKNQEKTIETTQLQIVCQRIEDIAQEKANNTLKTEIINITNNDLPKFKDIFFNFYENAVKQTTQQSKTQEFIEDQLIRNNQRISLDEIICQDFVTKQTLTKLTNIHLLRAERNSTGGFSYELSHDTLIEPILQSRKKRKEKEEEQRIENERKQEQYKAKEKAEKERAERENERKQQRRIIVIISIAAIISIAFGVFGFVNMMKLKKYLNSTEDAIFKETTEINTLQAYHKFINNYPYSQFKEDALNKIDSIDDAFFNDAFLKDSIPLYLEYLKLFEHGKHEAEVLKKLTIKPLAEYQNNSNIRTVYFLKNNIIVGSTTNGQIIEWSYNKGVLTEQNRYSSKFNKEILAMDISKSQNKIIFGDRNLYLYDVISKKSTKTLIGHNTQWVISGVCFFDNYQKAISASYDNQIIIWDLKTGKIIKKIKRGDNKNKIKSIDINEKNNLVTISFYNKDLGSSQYIEILSLKTLELIKKINFDEAVGYSCFSENDKLLVIAGTRKITLYDINTWTKKQIFTTGFTSGFIRKVIVINNIVIGAGDNNNIIFWKFNQKEPFEYIDNEQEIYFLNLDYENKLLLSSDKKSRLRIWDIKIILEGKKAYH